MEKLEETMGRCIMMEHCDGKELELLGEEVGAETDHTTATDFFCSKYY